MKKIILAFIAIIITITACSQAVHMEGVRIGSEANPLIVSATISGNYLIFTINGDSYMVPIDGAFDHTLGDNIGTNTHAQIDAALSSLASNLALIDSSRTSIAVDTIREYTTDAGVIIDGISITNHAINSWSPGNIISALDFGTAAYVVSYRTLLANTGILDIGTSGSPWRASYVLDSYIGSGGTNSIGKDGSNNMTFTDAVTGTKTLVELATEGAPDYGTSGQIPFMNGITDFNYSSDFTWTGGLNVNANIILGDLKGVYFGSDNNTSISESSADVLRFNLAGLQELFLSSTTLSPAQTGGLDLGTLAEFYDDVHFNRIYVGASHAYINCGSELQFTDGVTGTKTLAELAAGGGSSYTFSEGLTNASSTIILGQRPLTGNILFTDYENYQFAIGASDSIMDVIHLFSNDATFSSADVLTQNVHDWNITTTSSIKITGLSTDDTETYVMAIDNSTGVLSKRSVSSLGGGVGDDTVSLGTIAPLNSDTFTIYVFGTEGSSRFTTSATYQYGLYHNAGSDTLVIVGTHSLMQGTTPSLGMNIAWHATAFSGSATEAWTSDQTITSTTTGDNDYSPNNYYILPGDHVWFKTPTVGTAPDYAYVGLLVQRLNRSF